MAANPIVAMVWEGLNAIKTGHLMLGMTNPLASDPGLSATNVAHSPVNLTTGIICGDFALTVSCNICHGSNLVESAEKEIKWSVFSPLLQCLTLNADILDDDMGQ
jgi:nucleoside-diphosphate kinase